MYQPTPAQIRGMVGRAKYAPVYRDILADLETPVSAYLKLGGGAGTFLLESVEGGEHVGRYSFIGARPRQALEIREDHAILETPDGPRTLAFADPLVLLDELMQDDSIVSLPGLPRFVGGAVGFFSWEFARFFERLPAPDADPIGMPIARLMFVDTLLVFDHSRRTIKALTRMPLDGDIEADYAAAIERIDGLVAALQRPLSADSLASVPSHNEGIGLQDRVASNITPTQYMANVRKAKEYIKAGDIYQVQVGQRFKLTTTATPFAVYRAQRVLNPSPYMFFIDFGGYQLVGASPEILVLVEDGKVTTRPLAGTRWRGKTAEEDERIGRELLADQKECAEHVMLVDLGRNDVGRVSVPGTVRVDQLMEIERYSHVMHIVSNVTGQLEPTLRPLDAFRALFPAGTLSGAPKIRSMEIIAELETERRGAYGGAVGFIGWNGDVETAITIRTAVMKDGAAYVQAAAGVVADSDPAFEYEETVNKAAAMLRGVLAAERAASETREGVTA
jgi:anthranilate synthase component 1